LLLPYIEQDSLARRIDYTLPVEGPSAYSLRIIPLRMYTCPSDWETGVFTVQTVTNQPLADAATNSYAGCYGALGLMNDDPDSGTGTLYRNSRVRLDTDIPDGTSTTILVGERAAAFAQSPWAGVMTGGTCRTTPGAPVYNSMIELAPPMVLARAGNKNLNSFLSEPYDFFSMHGSVVDFLFADGSVHALSIRIDPTVLQALATRGGSEVLSGMDDF
jgi:prepilin-type processing-associated H-X9-DG protein